MLQTTNFDFDSYYLANFTRNSIVRNLAAPKAALCDARRHGATPRCWPPPPTGRLMSPKQPKGPQESFRGDKKSKLKAAEKKPADPPKPQVAETKRSLVLRREFEIESEKVGDLPIGTQVYVLETRETDKGKRACVAMSAGADALGWVTQAKDGVDHLVITSLPSSRAGAPATPKGEKSDKAKADTKSADKKAAASSQPPGATPGGKVGAASAGGSTGGKAGTERSPLGGGATTAGRSAGSFMAATKASSVAKGTGRAAQQRLSRLEKEKRWDKEVVPELENEEDFDWSTQDGGWTVNKWLSSLQLHMILAGAFASPEDEAEPDPADFDKPRSNAYTRIRVLSKEDVKERLSAPAVLEQLIDAVASGVEELKTAAAATGAALNTKFHMEGNQFEMAFGSLDLFFGGLEGIIGPPQMVHGSLRTAMEFDHCQAKDSRKPFEASNGLKSTSADEWELVTAPDLDKTYPERRAFRTPTGEELFPDKCRRPQSLRMMEELMEQQNERLEAGGHGKIIMEEVIAGRLCTPHASAAHERTSAQHSASPSRGIAYIHMQCGVCIPSASPSRGSHCIPTLHTRTWHSHIAHPHGTLTWHSCCVAFSALLR